MTVIKQHPLCTYREPDDCPELGRIVEGVLALHTQIDGPPRAYFESVREMPEPHVTRWLYDRVESSGATEPGTLENGGTAEWYESNEEALDRYRTVLTRYLKTYPKSDAVVVWRCRPRLERNTENKYRVYSRLVVL